MIFHTPGVTSLFSPLVESVVDNCIRKMVQEPAYGSVVYCALAFGQIEHSGIYVGKGEIVHLDGSGRVELVKSSTFLNRLDGLNLAISIMVSCAGAHPVGNVDAGHRALREVGRSYTYRLGGFNCHTFTAGCLAGHNTGLVTFRALRAKAKQLTGLTTWRAWNRDIPLQDAARKRNRWSKSAYESPFQSIMPPTKKILAPAATWPFPTSSRVASASEG